jgi:hypothetical protein
MAGQKVAEYAAVHHGAERLQPNVNGYRRLQLHERVVVIDADGLEAAPKPLDCHARCPSGSSSFVTY